MKIVRFKTNGKTRYGVLEAHRLVEYTGTPFGTFKRGRKKVVSRISQVMTLLPGDVIATGTPAGIGPMQPGDRIEVRIEGIGSLRNPVVALEGMGTDTHA